jgi:Na+-driven multidrug efflux pump
MSCFLRSLNDFMNLNKLAGYSIAANALDASFTIVTIVILGQLGKGHLSAGVIALAFYNIAWYFIEGVLTAQDTLVSQAFALNDQVGVRYWSYISFGVVMMLCALSTALFVFAAIIVQFAFMITPHTAAKAAEYLILLLPGLWFHAMYRVFQKYLQCQRQIKIPLLCALIGVGANILGK